MTAKGYPNSKFNALRGEFTAAEQELMNSKATEYAGEFDRLENFHQLGAIQGMAPMDITLTLMLKHVLSICKAVNTLNINWSWTSADGKEGLKQRIADMRNYGLLLAACIDEYVEKSQEARHMQDKGPRGVY